MRGLVRAAIVLALSWAGCGPSERPPAAGNDHAVSDEGFPVTITDDNGREVTLARAPRRIVSLGPAHTEILFAVGAGPQVVGVTTYCNYPPEADSREKVGGFSGPTIGLERVLGLEPDLIVTNVLLHHRAVEKLIDLHIPVVSFEPESLDQLYSTIHRIGRISGHAEQAGDVVERMQQRIDAVRRIGSRIADDQRVRVFYQVWDEPLMTASRHSFIGAMVQLAGGDNVFAELDNPYPAVSQESIIDRNPQVIIASAHGDLAEVKRKVLSRPGWDIVDAVKSKRIYFLEADSVSRAGPRLADALEQMAWTLYPDRFPQPATTASSITDGTSE